MGEAGAWQVTSRLNLQFLCSFICRGERRAAAQVVEVTTVVGILSRSLKAVCRGQWLRSHRLPNRFVREVKSHRGDADGGEKCLPAGTVSILLWRKY